jgi:hypothetical protein
MNETGMTGHLFEEKVIGVCKARWAGAHMRYREAVDEVRKSQPPLRTPTAAKLVALVSAKLGHPVRFCTAVGSCADVLHGVDGFFELQGKPEFVVTIDLTINPNKDACKADLLVTLEDIKNLPVLASRVAGRFRTQLQRRVV